MLGLIFLTGAMSTFHSCKKSRVNPKGDARRSELPPRQYAAQGLHLTRIGGGGVSGHRLQTP
jgi:hypothetical protein